MTVAAGMQRLAFLLADATRVVNSATSAAGHRETNPLLGVSEFFGVGHLGGDIGLAGAAGEANVPSDVPDTEEFRDPKKRVCFPVAGGRSRGVHDTGCIGQ